MEADAEPVGLEHSLPILSLAKWSLNMAIPSNLPVMLQTLHLSEVTKLTWFFA